MLFPLIESNESNHIFKFFELSPFFSSVIPHTQRQQVQDFRPTIDGYNRWFHSTISGSGLHIRCVKQMQSRRALRQTPFVSRDYQMSLFLLGELQTREYDWHDLFNAIAWLMFPLAKAALNRQYFYCLDARLPFPWQPSKTNRSKQEDAMTIFDEGGIVCVTNDDDAWTQLCAGSHMTTHQNLRCFIFGHGILDSKLQGHTEISGACVRVNLNPNGLCEDVLAKQVDAELARLIHASKGFGAVNNFVSTPLQNLFLPERLIVTN